MRLVKSSHMEYMYMFRDARGATQLAEKIPKSARCNP